jgi:hypothetical protein
MKKKHKSGGKNESEHMDFGLQVSEMPVTRPDGLLPYSRSTARNREIFPYRLEKTLNE